MENSVDMKLCGFEWKVANVISVDLVDSDEFSYDGHRWKLSLHVTTDPGFGNAIWYKIICLSKTSSGNLLNTYKVRCFIENTSKEHVVPFQHNLGTTFSTQEVWYIRTETLHANRNQYIKDGTLSFFITFTAMDGIDDKAFQNTYIPATLESLSLDLHQLRNDAIESDVTFECEGRSFPAHKALLSARSAVFAAMFRSDMMESRSGVIQIKDMEASVLDLLLQFAYTGKLPDLSVDTAPKLYAVADKYATELLKKLCAKYMALNLTKENACEVLVLADTHGDKVLKESVVSFIAKKKILRDKNIFFEFHKEHPMLATEVIHQAYEASLSQ